MTIDTKEGCLVPRINLHIHEVCIIVNTKEGNVLFDFDEGTKLKKELLDVLTVEETNKAIRFLTYNCSKLKFDKPKKKIKSQLSLF